MCARVTDGNKKMSGSNAGKQTVRMNQSEVRICSCMTEAALNRANLLWLHHAGNILILTSVLRLHKTKKSFESPRNKIVFWCKYVKPQLNFDLTSHPAVIYELSSPWQLPQPSKAPTSGLRPSTQRRITDTWAAFQLKDTAPLQHGLIRAARSATFNPEGIWR